MKIIINGKLPSGVYAKDVILHIIRNLTVNGATDRVTEFVGPVVDAMSMESRMTLCNMAVEAGATCGVCLPDRVTAEYLWPFIKDNYASIDEAVAEFRRWNSDPDAKYSETVVYDLTELEPQVTYGFKPDEVKGVSEMEGTPVDQVYIGSCTNGRIEDLREAARILEGKKIADTVRGILVPATPKVFNDAMSEGIMKVFLDAGFCVTNPTCGACLGMSTGVLAEGEICASTTNRNFNGRMGKGGIVHLMSPATAAATAISGHISDPRPYLLSRSVYC